MESNRSLQLSYELRNYMSRDLLSMFNEMYPFEMVEKYKRADERDRVFNTSTTLLTMILSEVQQDKSLQNAVNIYSGLHSRNISRIQKKEEEFKNTLENKEAKRKPGRPRKGIGRTAKSKTKEISRDTSGYSQARQRINQDVFNAVFQESVKSLEAQSKNKWHEMDIFITDGTYLQMQDSKENRKVFTVNTPGYPRGLLQVIIKQGCGSIHNFKLSPDTLSELALFKDMIDSLPAKSLLLADDLYNSFLIFYMLKERSVEIIVPGKRKRNYKHIKNICSGDEIVELKGSSTSGILSSEEMVPYRGKILRMRRIEYSDPNDENKKRVLWTSILDTNITKEDIILKYESRWDIEVSIREIKTIMDINIVRAKSPGMAVKEVTSALIAYNYVRTLVAEAAAESDFSPEVDLIQKYYEIDTPSLVDKLGRKYSKWSPGRKGKT